MEESEIIELINKNEQCNDFNSEIDPFSSEKGDSNSEINENFSEYSDNVNNKYSENDSKTSDNFSENGGNDNVNSGEESYDSDNFTDSSDHFSGNEDDLSQEVSTCKQVKVFVPMVSLNEILVKVSVPFNISELLEKLKEEENEEQTTIFDSNDKFNGRIYCNNRIVTDETELIEDESAKIILIHNLMRKEYENTEFKVEAETRTRSKPTLMSKFKNLWTIKEKAKISIEIKLNSGTLIFIEQVLNYLRRDEMIQEGLFRLSGTFTRIKSLQDRLNSGDSFNADLNLTASDCHNVTSLLKQFLRNLPEPLLTFELYESWQALGDWTGQTEIAVKIANFLVNQLPKLNKKILEDLMKFLNERLKDSEITRMNACNFGTVIGPNLLWHPQEDRQMRDSTTLGLSLQSSTLASQICTLFLQNYNEIFDINTLHSNPVMAYGKVVYDYSIDDECGVESESCESSNSLKSTVSDEISSGESSSDGSLRAGQIIFINCIDDSIDGWWLAYFSNRLSKFPSNYVQVLAQRSDEELIKLL
jgi:hypothetical protein